MQNVRRAQDFRASLNENDSKKFLASPLLERFEIINENFVLFKMKKPNLILNKPIYVGFTVLELSKLRMYKLYYRNFKKNYKEKCQLVYCDTDSLYLSIECFDAYKDLKEKFSHIVDFSNYPENHFMHATDNKGKLGYLKSETIKPIKSFIGLKSKMYTYILEDNTYKMTVKGIKKSSLKEITFETYKDILMSNSLIRTQQHSIVSKNHTIQTIEQNKISLSAYYDKKILNSDGITSTSYGHHRNDSLLDDLKKS